MKLLFSQVPATAEYMCFVAELVRAVISSWLKVPSLKLCWAGMVAVHLSSGHLENLDIYAGWGYLGYL